MGFLQQIALPTDISRHGNLIDWLFNYTTIMNLFFFALVCGGLFGFCYFYHHRRHPKAYYTYGNKKRHLMVTALLGVLVFLSIDLNIVRISNDDYLKVFNNWPSEKEDIFRVEVLAQQWAWSFRYPGEDGIFNTEDDFTTINDLRIPLNKKVVFQIISKDVIHSLFFPNTRRKVDAIPGRITRLWFLPIKTGVYDIACAEMCGTYHYRMQAKLTVYSPEEFAHWIEREQTRAKVASNEETKVGDELYWGWAWQ